MSKLALTMGEEKLSKIIKIWKIISKTSWLTDRIIRINKELIK